MTTVLKALLIFAVLASVECKGAKKAKEEVAEPAQEEHEESADEASEGAGEGEDGKEEDAGEVDAGEGVEGEEEGGAEGEEGKEGEEGGEEEGGEEEAPHDEGDEPTESLTEDQLRKMHAKFDGNGDGKVSFEEIIAFSQTTGKEIAKKDGETGNSASMLVEIDGDKDGKVSLEEHLKDIHSQHEGGNEVEMAELEHIKGHEAEKFKAADTNGDGLLDKDELPHMFFPEHHEGVMDVTVAQTMRKRDGNKDGKLTVLEFWHHDNSTEADLSKEEKVDFAKLDGNSDGFVDAKELRAWESGSFHTEDIMTKLFELADKDTDKHITADEMAKAAGKIATCDAQHHLMEWAEHHGI